MLKLFRRITYFLQRRRVDRELAQEVELHRVLSAERLEHDGLDAEAARRDARVPLRLEALIPAVRASRIDPASSLEG